MGAAKHSRHALVTACLSLIATIHLATAPAAQASSLPTFDTDRGPVIGVGSGPSVSLNWRLTDDFAIGLSGGLNIFDGAAWRIDPSTFGIVRYDLNGLYLLRDGGPTGVTIAAVGGLWGDTSFLRQPIEGLPVGLEGGFALSYPFLPKLIGRINFLVSYQLFASPLGYNLGAFPPAAGLELAYFPMPGLELTVGYNGQGDVVGLRWRL